jgi:Domain of unknown function (DUF4292)
MKTIRNLALTVFILSFAAYVSAQSADEILAKYIQAVGGKDLITNLKSVYSEGTIEVMGMQGSLKSWVLNGRGARQDMEINGATITNCYTDNGGWSLNPMMGSTSAEAMSDDQYNAGKEGINIGAPYLNYAAKGYKAELLATDTINGAKAYKIKLTSPSNRSTVHQFNASNFYLVQTTVETEMQGQQVENVISYSDYKSNDGYMMPTKMEMSMAGGQFVINMTLNKIELNKQVADTLFAKPK